MKVLIDFNQIVISNIAMESLNQKHFDIDENLVRHMVLSSVQKYKKMFGIKDRRDLIFCLDGPNYWRKNVFPYYKHNRKKHREKSPINWEKAFQIINTITTELKTQLPYTVIQVDTAEGDDIIAVLCEKCAIEKQEEIIIISSDKDYIQLQKFPKVRQYSPRMKKFLTCKDPSQFLKEHIISGDRNDGIPNCLSEDNCFVTNTRQKRMTEQKKEFLLRGLHEPTILKSNELRGIGRNTILIDLSKSPQDLRENIWNEYLTKYSDSNEGKSIYQYFRKNKLMNLMNRIEEF